MPSGPDPALETITLRMLPSSPARITEPRLFKKNKVGFVSVGAMVGVVGVVGVLMPAGIVGVVVAGILLGSVLGAA
jgi:hypothetical protein